MSDENGGVMSADSDVEDWAYELCLEDTRAKAISKLAGLALGEVHIAGRLVIVAIKRHDGGVFVASTRTGHTEDLVRAVCEIEEREG